MQIRRNTWPTLALAAAFAVAPMLGCDSKTTEADKKVLSGVAAGVPVGTPEDADASIKALDELSKDQNISVGRRSLAKAALAAAEMDAAKLSLTKLQENEAKVATLLWEIENASGQMRAIQGMIDIAKRRNPAEPLPKEFRGEKSVSEAIAKSTAAAKSGDQPWVKSDTAPLANAAQVKAKIEELTGKINKIKGDIDTLTKQRDTAAADAAKAQQESENARGEASTKAFMRGAELRKQAANLSIQIEAANASLLPLTQDLATAQAHEKQVQAAIAAFDATNKVYTDDYARTTKSIEDLTASAKAILDGDKDSIKTLAIEVNKLLAEAAELRNEVTEKYKSAEAHFGDAIKDAESARQSMKTDADANPADKMLADLASKSMEASSLRLRRAEAFLMLGAVHNAHAHQLQRRLAVATYVAAGATPMSLSIPAELSDGKAEDASQEARKSAEAAYKEADDLAVNVIDGATNVPPSTTATAKLFRAVLNAGRSQLAAAFGEADKAKTLLADAQGFQKEVDPATAGVVFPDYLPVITHTRQAASTPAPAPTPATVPSTPAVEPAPTPQPEAPAPGTPLMPAPE